MSALGVFAYLDVDTATAKGILDTVDSNHCLFRSDLERMNNDLAQAGHAIAAAMAAPLGGVISHDAEKLYRALIHPDTVITPCRWRCRSSMSG